jgi:hypothetical protein
MPRSSSFTPKVKPEPIVYVLPLPVCPYASTVALNPLKHPRTKFLTQTSNTSCYDCIMSKVLSNVNTLSFPIVTVFCSLFTSTQILEFSNISLGSKGRIRSATRTEHAAWLLNKSLKKPS